MIGSEYAVYRMCNRYAGPRQTYNQNIERSSYEIRHTEEFWRSLPGSVGMENAISIIDTSSSMMAYGAHTVADSLGLFYAEHAKCAPGFYPLCYAKCAAHAGLL